jgi:two-component sensor histidine kinase
MGSESEPKVREALSETQARISAVAGMHRSLYTSDDVRHVDLDIYLKRLVDELEGSLGESGHFGGIDLDLDAIELSSDRAVSVGMIVTELVTNAIKYAYRDRPAGRIAVSLKRLSGDRAILVVEDDGNGIPEKVTPQGTGLVTRIVTAMAAAIGDGLKIVPKSQGTRIEVDVKIQ